MLAWIKSPSGSIATAAAVAAILALFWLTPPHGPGYRSLLSPQPGSAPMAPASTAQDAAKTDAGQAAPGNQAAPGADQQASLGGSPPLGVNPRAGNNPPAPAAGQMPAAGQAPAGEQPAEAKAPQPATGAPADASTPSFDVVRVQPDGETVIAGRGVPGSTIDLVDQGSVVAHITVDKSGQFAILPPKLAEGSHYLTLQSTLNGQPVFSTQGVAVAVAKGGVDKPLVAVLAPDQPARVLSDGAPVSAAGPAGRPAAQPATGAVSVAIQTVEAAQGGRFTASGVARPGSQCRLYLNGAFLADVITGPDGRWSVKIEKGMRPGKYTVRADELEPSTGKVVNRAEVPFDYPVMAASEGDAKHILVSKASKAPNPAALVPAQTASAAPKTVSGTAASGSGLATTASPASTPQVDPQAAADAMALAQSPDPAAAAAVVAELQTAKVVRGDSLWRISRKMLGHGVNYTEIYASNVSQIRDPRLIYPGQILVVPNRAVN